MASFCYYPSQQPQTSLEILSPPTNGDTIYSSDDSALAQELMSMSQLCVQDINNHTILTSETVPPFIAPDFKGLTAGYPDSNNYHNYLELHRQFAEINPGYHVHVIHTSTDIDQETGHACVFMLVEIVGRPWGTRRGAVLLWKWRKSCGRWLLFRKQGIRGMCGVLEGGAGVSN